MSFSKARIQRFNELGSEAPAPGAYDPKFEKKVKGLAIEKTERFQDTKSVTSSGGADCASVSSKGAGSTSGQSGSARKFKTPPVPRKRVIAKPTAMSCPRAKSKPLIVSKDPKSQYDLETELADLRVECLNKSRTILEQEKHIEEMKGEISLITKRLSELNTKCSADDEQHQKDIESMATLQQEVLDSQKMKHNAELDFLRTQILELANFKKEEIRELDRREHELEEEIFRLRRQEAELNQRIAMLESNLLNAQGVEELAMNLKKAEERLTELSTEMFEIIESKDRDLENLMEARTEVEEELSLLREQYQQSQEKVNELQCNLENFSESLESNLASSKSKMISEIVHFLQVSLNPLNPEEEISVFISENGHVGETIKKMIEDFKTLKNQEMEDFKNKFEVLEKENQSEKLMRMELEIKANECGETINFLTEELRDVQRLYQDVSLELEKAKAKLKTTDERLAQAEEAHKADLDTLSKLDEKEQSKLKSLMEEARLEYLQQLENMSEARNQELEEMKEATEKMIEEEKNRIKEHADKLVQNAEAVTRETLAACRAESEERVKRVIAETDAKVNSIVRDVKKAAEEEMRLASERFTTSSKRLEAEKASLEEKLIEKDSEMSELRTALDELKRTAETQESFSQSLQAELDRAETELAEKKEELRNLKDHIRSEAAEMVARRRRFEVVMSENQASVCALTNRIAESDAEVKRLLRELENSESSLREHRDLLSSVQSNSKLLQEQVHAIADQLKLKESLVDQIEENCKTDIQAIKSALESKIDNVIEATAVQVSKLEEDSLNKTKLNAELKQLLDEMALKWNQVQSTLLKLEEESDEQLTEIATLQNTNAKLKMDLKKQTALANESKARESEIDEAKAQVKDLSIKVATLEATNLCLKEEMDQSEEERQSWKTVENSLMEDLERERAGREKTEREMKVLSENFERFRSEYEELTEKYTEVLGHHNNNQRIKHISKLKDKILTQQKDNLRLKQELESKTNLLEQLTKNSERAKLEEKRKVGKGKENISTSYLGKATPVQKVGTLSKSANTTPAASPNKTLTPLRNRNE